MAIERQSKVGAGGEPSVEKATTFIKEVQTELKKTTWPTKEEALRLTYVVIAIIVVIGFYMAGLDWLFNNVINRFMHH